MRLRCSRAARCALALNVSRYTFSGQRTRPFKATSANFIFHCLRMRIKAADAAPKGILAVPAIVKLSTLSPLAVLRRTTSVVTSIRRRSVATALTRCRHLRRIHF